jgi:hypothetical protein
VAIAVCVGAGGLEAAAVVTGADVAAGDAPGLAAVRDLAAAAPVYLLTPDGTLVGTL